MEITEIHFDSIDSTNSYAKREYTSFPKDKITCISSDVQTAGRGRHQRKWVSPKEVNLYATFCFRLPSQIADLSSLAIVASYSLATLLKKEGFDPKIKWPNDVQLQGKKVSGILCEMIFEKNWVQIFLGIGLNVNMERADLEQIDQPATSLKAETGRVWNRKELLKRFQAQLIADLERFKKEGFTSFHSAVESLLAQKGEKIQCFDGRQQWEGICHSLGKDGRLKLLLPDGSFHEIHTNDLNHRNYD